MKPPFSYYGGKMTLGPVIAALLPDHDHYVEPFAGSLAVLLAKPPSRAETVNDIDGDLVTFWRVLRDRPDDLARLCFLTPHARAELDASKRMDSDDELERARQVWTVLTQSRSHSMKPTGWKYEIASSGLTGRLETCAERIVPAAARLKGVSLENRDALDVIADYGREPSVCIYADPPYLGSTRAQNYRVEMLEDDLHERLACALMECEASVVLSGYESPLYEGLFDGWHRTSLSTTRSLSGRAKVPEVLWSNRPLADGRLEGIA